MTDPDRCPPGVIRELTTPGARVQCPWCDYFHVTPDSDEMEALVDVIDHVSYRHKQQDQTPGVLWPQFRSSQ